MGKTRLDNSFIVYLSTSDHILLNETFGYCASQKYASNVSGRAALASFRLRISQFRSPHPHQRLSSFNLCYLLIFICCLLNGLNITEVSQQHLFDVVAH